MAVWSQSVPEIRYILACIETVFEIHDIAQQFLTTKVKWVLGARSGGLGMEIWISVC